MDPLNPGPPGGAASLPRAVTLTDLWKAAAILLVLVDHYGLYFVPEPSSWRLAGRAAAPVFFFLIGFAATRRVPPIWLALGAGLTLARVSLEPGGVDLFGNILLNFALLRLAVLPLAERWVLPHPGRVAALILACAAVLPVSKLLLEYGTEGWLWALFGLAQRRAGEGADPRAAWTRNTLAGAAGVAFLVSETASFGFGPQEAAVLAALTGTLVLGLGRFRRQVLAVQPPEPAAALLRFGGRWTLEIYALTLLGMQILAYARARGWA